MTPVQLKAYDFIREMIAAGCPPSYEEIATAIGCRSKGNVGRIVERLIQQGKLVRTASHVRGLALPDMVDLKDAPTDALRAELARRGETLDALARPRPLRGDATCAANRCGEQIHRGMLFCRRHWFLLSLSLQHDLKAKWAARELPAFQADLDSAREYLDRRESVG